jgi:8-oxo-dGTP pyrophosphatase MutT (NUDIX family)
MNKEMVFIVDENNNPLEPQPRDVMIRDNLWCRVASIVVIDSESNMVLCQKRSETKDQRPGLWVVEFGGKAEPEENCLITAQRELFEESGIECETSELTFSGLEKSVERHQFAYCYYLNRPNTTNVSPDPREVSAIQWLPVRDAISNLENNPEWYSYGNDLKILQKFIN